MITVVFLTTNPKKIVIVLQNAVEADAQYLHRCFLDVYRREQFFYTVVVQEKRDTDTDDLRCEMG